MAIIITKIVRTPSPLHVVQTVRVSTPVQTPPIPTAVAQQT
jgi:hypothetical protein